MLVRSNASQQSNVYSLKAAIQNTSWDLDVKEVKKEELFDVLLEYVKVNEQIDGSVE